MIENQDFNRSSGHRILVVDDITANRTVITRRLELFGHEVTAVASGFEALESISGERPDLVLLDHMMPRMSGIEVLTRLRSDPVTADIPVFVITARAEREAAIQAIKAGADEHLTKPVDYANLKKKLEKYLGNKPLVKSAPGVVPGMDGAHSRTSSRLGGASAPIDRRRNAARKTERRAENTSPQLTRRVGDNSRADPALLVRVREQFDVVFDAALSGEVPNIAQLSQIREALDRLS